MTATRGVVVVLLVVSGLAIAPIASAALTGAVGPTVGSFSESPSTDSNPADTGTDTTGEDSESDTGLNVSEFIHSSAVGTEMTVDAEMFNASYENADEEARTDIVTDRIETLEERISSLEDERESLRQHEENVSDAAYQARMTRLAVELSSLQGSIDAVDQRAADAGVNTSAVDDLQANASALGGEEVAAAATGLSGVDVPGDRANAQSPPDRGDDSTENDRSPNDLDNDGVEDSGDRSGSAAGEDAGDQKP